MNYGCRPLVLALTLALATAPAAADEAALQRLLVAPGLDIALTGHLYREAVLDDEGIQGLYARLGQVVDSDVDSHARALALLARASMRWEQGDAVQAMADVDQALTLAPGPDAWRLKASLLDARGDGTAAAEWYRKAVEASAQEGEGEVLRRRLALLDARAPAAALRELVRGSGTQPRNRMAVALALLGHPDDALALFTVQGKGASVYVQHIQAADWALAAGRHAQARELSWAAFGAAGNAADQRYALALLMESWREAGALPEAVTFLASRPANLEVEQVRVDTLLELQRYDEAIALVRASPRPQLRQRLLGILELAGRREEMAAEYRRLIQAQPHSPVGHDGLAALYVGEDKPDQALEVYRTLFANNRGRTDLLIPAARQMSAMGLHAQAMELLAQDGNDAAMAIAIDFFLFDAHLDQGQDAQAGQVLERLQRRLPAADPRQVEVADGYERLQRPERALAVLEQMERQRQGGVDYDLQVRMADLAVKSGHGEAALARLRRLWEQTRLPARRSFLERQIVRVAQSLDHLDGIAAELDARLATGNARRSEVDLLVAIRLAQKNRDAAEAAVSRYAGSGGDPVQRLTQLSDFYVRLHDGEQIDRTLRQLAEADPANADLYLRKLAINTLRQPARTASGELETPQAQQARVERLIEQLQAGTRQSGAEASRFAAGLYEMAGMSERAIDAYRRALAQAPGDIDSLLQLAEQLRKGNRTDEAVAMLQYAAERATDQKAFVLAIDGLVGLFSAGEDAASRRSGQARLAGKVLPWAQRRVLERISGSDDVYPLYALLADVGLVQADFDLQVRAYENSLPLAGDQRPLILRQLVTLNSSASSSDGATGPTLGDDGQKIRFGRRLIALKREFPPDFYADLARTLLAGGDTLGAERAFSVMTDIGGLVNLAQIKGDAYAAEGYAEQALLNYGQALARDQDDLDLLLKTSILHERQGQFEIAHHWYWHALRRVILRQPQRDGGVVAEGGLDLQRYFPSLVEGLLLTWPDDAAQEQENIAMLRGMFDDAIAQVALDGATSLAQHPRLRLIVALQRRIAESRRDFVQADAFEVVLAHTFADDPEQRADAEYFRRLTARSSALPVAAAAAGEDWALRALQAQASQEGRAGNPALALALAVASEDTAGLETLVRRALETERNWRASNANRLPTDPGPGTLYQLLVQGSEHLPADMFRRAVYAPLQAEPFHDEVLLNLYRGSPERYAELERLLGAPPLSDDVLIRLLAEHGNDPMPYRPPPRDPSTAGVGGLTSRFSVEQQITLYQILVDRLAKGATPSMLQSALLQRLLQQPLSSSQQARTAAIVRKEVNAQPAGYARTAASMAPGLLVLDAAPSNRALLVQLAELVAQTYPDGTHLPGFFSAYFAGDREGALARLQDFQHDTGMQGGMATSLTSSISRSSASGGSTRFLRNPAPGQKEAAAFYQEFVLGAMNGQAPPPRATLVRYYEKLLTLDPDNTTWLTGLLALQLQASENAAFLSTLQPYVERNPDDAEAAAVLALAYRAANQQPQAEAVVQASGVDIDDAELIVRMINRANAPRQGAFEPDFGRLFLEVYGNYQTSSPDAPVVVAVQARQRAVPSQRHAVEDRLRPLAKAFAEHPDSTAGVLRGLWRQSAPGERQQLLMIRFDSQGGALDTSRGRARRASGESMPSESPDLLAAMAALPSISDEYERYLRALPAEIRPRRQRLYDLLAQGLIAQGQSGAWMERLQQELMDGRIDAHQLQILATLSVRSGVVFAPEQRQALLAWLRTTPSMVAEQRELLARVLADAGDPVGATGLLEAAIMQSLFPDGPDSPGYDPWDGAVDALAGILERLGQWQDREAARRTYADLRRMIDTRRTGSHVRMGDLKPPAWLEEARPEWEPSSK
ncbi:Flagellar hook-length control protein FliK [plant metagenome]|uniref:Flagellar hook-length control protein FliK n=1 Tax=plant metagenome TaxID=1297885 RepID=A0A484P6R9_9ZZZZ